MKKTKQSLHTAPWFLAGLLAVCSFIILMSQRASATNSSSAFLPVLDGAVQQWTPSAKGTHSSLVDESTCNGNVDYVYTSTPGAREQFVVNIDSVPAGAMISSIQIVPCAAKHQTVTGASATMNVYYSFNGTNGPDLGGYAFGQKPPMPLNPAAFDGLSLVKQPGSVLQIGAAYVAGGAGARLSRLAANLTYTLAPSMLKGEVHGSQIYLTWSDNANDENGYVVERSTQGSAGSWSVIATLDPNVTSYLDGSVSPNHDYFYRVSAKKGSGHTGYSQAVVVFATVAPNPPTKMSAMLPTTATSAILVKWSDESMNEQGFILERGATTKGEFVPLITLDANTTQYLDGAISPGKTYAYRVKAVNVVGESVYAASQPVFVP